MDWSLRVFVFIATVETSMLMFTAPHSSQLHNGAKLITKINLRINEFLMGFWPSEERTKSHFLLSSRAKKNQVFGGRMKTVSVGIKHFKSNAEYLRHSGRAATILALLASWEVTSIRCGSVWKLVNTHP